MSKTLVIPQKSKLYVQSQGVACNIAATVHYMKYSMDADNNETYKELVSYSDPSQNNVNVILPVSTVSNEKRIVREFYFYNTAGSTQSFSLRVRSYTDITLAAGTGAGQLDNPANYIDTNLLDFVIPSHKVWRFTEAFLLHYPSVIVLSEESNFDEISIVLAATGTDVLTESDRIHCTISHGEVQDGSEVVINERLEQKIVAKTASDQVFSLFKLPDDVGRNPNATVIRQIALYNESGKTIHVKLGFGPPTSTTLNGYLFDGNIASNESWWSDANTFQHIEDYIPDPDPNSPGSYALNTVSPLQFIQATQTIRINRSGANDGQALLWDNTSNEWKPGDVQPLLTPVAPLEYDLSNLEIKIGQDSATENQVLAWRESTTGAGDFRWRPTNASGIGGGGGGGGGSGGNGVQIPNLDGGTADSVFGGVAPFDAGNANP